MYLAQMSFAAGNAVSFEKAFVDSSTGSLVVSYPSIDVRGSVGEGEKDCSANSAGM